MHFVQFDGIYIDGVDRTDSGWGTADAFYKGWDQLWPAVMEAAAMQMAISFDKSTNKDISGGSAANAARLLYGRAVEESHPYAPDFDTAILKNANKWPMWLITPDSTNGKCACPVKAIQISYRPNLGSWVGGHAYSVLSSDDSTVTVFNPWAHAVPEGSSNVNGGKFDIPIHKEAGSSCFTCGSVMAIFWLKL